MPDRDPVWSVDRRAFLKLVSLAGLSGLVSPGRLLSSQGPADLSRVIIVEDTAATSGSTIITAVVQSMMDCGVMSLAGIYDVGEAWKSLLPGVSTSSVIVIKVNCINSPLSSHPQVASAIANGLKQMDFSGTLFPENNIIIFDRTNGELTAAGYTKNTSGTGVRCFGTNQSGVGYSSTAYSVNGSTQYLSRILTDMGTHLINLSCLKNHGQSGVTHCLKNHYGTCNNPGGLHDNDCDPYIPALNALAPIRDKQFVNICDALFGIYSGGPSGNPQFAANTLVLSRDIVACDYCCREILADHGCTTLEQAHHIETAAATYGLGTCDPGQMDVVTIQNPSGIEAPDRLPGGSANLVVEQNRPNPFGTGTEIRFYLASPGKAELDVLDVEGRSVRSLGAAALTTGWHQVPWDGRTDSGQPAAAGVYFFRVRAGGSQRAVAMRLVR